MTKTERKILDFIEKNRIIIFMAILTVIAIITRFALFDFESGDYQQYISQWFDYLKYNGHLKALKNFPGDYNAPYMTLMALLSYLPFRSLYLIKLVSVVFDFALAIVSGRLVYLIVDKNKKWLSYLTYVIVLFLPQVLLNGSFWGQCDSMYATFSILSLILLLEKKYTKAFIALGFSFAFKLQFVFILPIFVILYFSKKEFSIANFLIIPLVNFILCLPAIIAGKPIIECMSIYFNQTETYESFLQLNFINIYQFITKFAEQIRPAGILFTIAICSTILLFVLEKNIKWNNEKILTLTLWFFIVITFVLPCMHDRYLFVGEILSVIYYMAYRKNGMIVAMINLNAVITYSRFLFWRSDEMFSYLAIIYLFLLLHFTKKTFELLNDKN